MSSPCSPRHGYLQHHGFRVPRSSCPSDAPDAHNVEDSLPVPELRLHITIEVVGRLRFGTRDEVAIMQGALPYSFPA
jgi:hypothetical protein